MKAQVARKIESRIWDSFDRKYPLEKVFNHKGKRDAISYIFENRERLFQGYCEAESKLSYLESLPWIGVITKYHLAKNLGFNVIKPDRHLTRIAMRCAMTPNEMCENLSKKTGDKLTVIDTVIWRAANLGFI